MEVEFVVCLRFGWRRVDVRDGLRYWNLSQDKVKSGIKEGAFSFLRRMGENRASGWK
jgi:hypothetical protein